MISVASLGEPKTKTASLYLNLPLVSAGSSLMRKSAICRHIKHCCHDDFKKSLVVIVREANTIPS